MIFKKLTKWLAGIPIVGILAIGTAAVVIGAQQDGNSASAKSGTASTSSSGSGGTATSGSKGLYTNGEYSYDNASGAPTDLSATDFPVLTSLQTSMTTKNLANLGTIKNVRIDGLTITGASGSAPTFISEISLIAPDGTHIPYKMNAFLSTASTAYPNLTAVTNLLQDLNYAHQSSQTSITINTTGNRFSLDLIKPSLISRIEIATDANLVGNVMLTDTFNNYWTSQSTFGTRTGNSSLYSVSTDSTIASVPTSTQTGRTNNPVLYGASASQYALSNVSFAGRKVFPGVATRFYQYFNYGFDPLYSISYPAAGKEGISLFYQGGVNLEAAVRSTTAISSRYDGSNFSIGHVRLADVSASV